MKSLIVEKQIIIDEQGVANLFNTFFLLLQHLWTKAILGNLQSTLENLDLFNPSSFSLYPVAADECVQSILN